MPPALPELEAVQHRFVDLPDLRMHIAEAGEGDPVVLVHGWFQHWWEWRRLIPGLAEHYRVICPDLRGFGWSDAPSGSYAKEELAGDLVALFDALELDRVRLVGHDWGAVIGYLVCLEHPERVERYVALSGGHPFITVSAGMLGTMWRFWYMQPIAVPGLGSRLVGGGKQRLPRLLRRWVTVQEDAWSAEDEELFLAQLREPERARASSALYRTFLLREFLPTLRGRYKGMRLRTPTLYLLGASDPSLRPAFVRGIERYADDMQLELIDGVGHFLPEEAPHHVLDRTLEFFGRSPAPAGP